MENETIKTASGTTNQVITPIQTPPAGSSAISSLTPFPKLYASGSNITAGSIPVDSLSNIGSIIPATNQPIGSAVPKPTATAPAPATSTNQATGLDKIVSDYLSGTPTPPSTYDAYQAAKEASGISATQNEVNDLQAKLNAITARSEAAGLTQEGRKGVTIGAISGAQADIRRKAAIEALPVSAALNAAQGKLSAAQTELDTAFKLKMEDATNQYNYLKEQRQLQYDYLTKKEQREIDAQQAEDDRNWELTKANMNTISDLANTAMNNGLPSVAADIASLDPADPEFRTKLSALQGKIQVSNLDDQYKALQIAKLRQEISSAVTGGAGGENVQLYSGLSSPTATAVRSQVSAFKSEPIVTNFAILQEGRNFAQSLSNDTNNPADDQALIYSLAKVLDPNSVVREGEYATAQKYAQSWIKAYGKGVTQAILGTGFLSKEARENIKKTIESKYVSSEKSYSNLLDQYVTGINNLTGRSDGRLFLRDYSISNNQQDIQDQIQLPQEDEDVWNSVFGESNTTNQQAQQTTQPKTYSSLGGLSYTQPSFNLGNLFNQ